MSCGQLEDSVLSSFTSLSIWMEKWKGVLMLGLDKKMVDTVGLVIGIPYNVLMSLEEWPELL